MKTKVIWRLTFGLAILAVAAGVYLIVINRRNESFPELCQRERHHVLDLQLKYQGLDLAFLGKTRRTEIDRRLAEFCQCLDRSLRSDAVTSSDLTVLFRVAPSRAEFLRSKAYKWIMRPENFARFDQCSKQHQAGERQLIEYATK